MSNYIPPVNKHIPLNKSVATAGQKENFRARFAEIVCDNARIKNKYSIQFFETPQKSNYVFTSLDGRSMNVFSLMTIEEVDRYRNLKNTWQD